MRFTSPVSSPRSSSPSPRSRSSDRCRPGSCWRRRRPPRGDGEPDPLVQRVPPLRAARPPGCGSPSRPSRVAAAASPPVSPPSSCRSCSRPGHWWSRRRPAVSRRWWRSASPTARASPASAPAASRPARRPPNGRGRRMSSSTELRHGRHRRPPACSHGPTTPGAALDACSPRRAEAFAPPRRRGSAPIPGSAPVPPSTATRTPAGWRHPAGEPPSCGCAGKEPDRCTGCGSPRCAPVRSGRPTGSRSAPGRPRDTGTRPATADGRESSPLRVGGQRRAGGAIDRPGPARRHRHPGQFAVAEVGVFRPGGSHRPASPVPTSPAALRSRTGGRGGRRRIETAVTGARQAWASGVAPGETVRRSGCQLPAGERGSGRRDRCHRRRS